MTNQPLDQLRAALAERYTIERELGRGGMATVYLAQDLKHHRAVAIKVLRPELTDLLGRERFLREIEIAAGLQHPNILPLYDSGAADGLLFYVMPYVAGESLRDRMDREKQLPLEDALRICGEVADALHSAHGQEIVHRDIKPGNILLSGGHALVADFGIARAISAAGGTQLTERGIAVGTPAYMSPEQASGQDALDGRSDLYSLGCVLYEMLAGEPPFTGRTAQAVIARHLQERPPSLRVVRPTVSLAVQKVIETALAKVPADRYPTAARFVAALEAAQTGRAARSRRLLAGAAVVALIAGGFFVARRMLQRAELDSTRYVLLPFDHRVGAAPVLLDGDQCQWRLSQAFRRWDGVTVADNFQITDARRRRGDALPTQNDWLAVARDLGAGRLVRGEVAQFGDTVYVTATVFDVARSGRALQQAITALRPQSVGVAEEFQRLAAQLLGLDPPAGSTGASGTRSLPAGRAFAAGEKALAAGDFRSAEARFLEASQLDPGFGDARFWLAQVMAWEGKDAETWVSTAQSAADLRPQLVDPRARSLAEPLVDLARGRLLQACDRYRALVQRDSTDFAAWFGLGECQFRDDLVLRDSASPSSWGFRSSYDAAAEAYRRGLAIAPWFTGAFFFRLSRLLIVEPNRLRVGRVAPPDTATFWAYPELAQGRVRFFPHPAAEVRDGKPWTVPASREAALTRNRAALREIADSWARAYPGSAEALAAVAQVLESLARSEQGAGALREALTHIRRARSRAQGDDPRIRMTHTEARLLLKLGEFAAARELTDSVLRATRKPDPAQASRLAGLAALTGRAVRAGQLLALHAPELHRAERFAQVPLAVLETRERLRAYAALGAPIESLRVLPARVDSLLRAWTGGPPPEPLRSELLAEPVALAFPLIGRSAPIPVAGGNDLLQMHWMLSDGRAAALRARFDTLRALRQDLRPQDVAMSRTYQEVWLMVQLGDTATAVERLDLVLGGLPAFGGFLLSDAPDPAALVRAMALRAELAGRTGEAPTARRWAAVVATLWRDADPDLQPLVEQMKTLVRAAGRSR